jgi:hypothetical protein
VQQDLLNTGIFFKVQGAVFGGTERGNNLLPNDEPSMNREKVAYNDMT